MRIDRERCRILYSGDDVHLVVWRKNAYANSRITKLKSQEPVKVPTFFDILKRKVGLK
tara:strand:- start:14525 stop:14698 length:174 start_codon:yes stop_codon:yes gene_type:complete